MNLDLNRIRGYARVLLSIESNVGPTKLSAGQFVLKFEGRNSFGELQCLRTAEMPRGSMLDLNEAMALLLAMIPDPNAPPAQGA